ERLRRQAVLQERPGLVAQREELAHVRRGLRRHLRPRAHRHLAPPCSLRFGEALRPQRFSEAERTPHAGTPPQPTIVMAPLNLPMASPATDTIRPLMSVMTWPWTLIIMPLIVTPVWSSLMLLWPTFSSIDCIASVELLPMLTLVVSFPILMTVSRLPFS